MWNVCDENEREAVYAGAGSLSDKGDLLGDAEGSAYMDGLHDSGVGHKLSGNSGAYRVSKILGCKSSFFKDKKEE